MAYEPDYDFQIAEEERHRMELDLKLNEYRKNIQRMKLKENDVLSRLDRYRQDAEKTRRDIAVLELQAAKLKSSIAKLNEEMKTSERMLAELKLSLARRMVDIYKYGLPSELSIILSAESMHDAVNSVYLLSRLSEHDKELVAQLRNRQMEIALSKKTLEDHSERLDQQSKALMRERDKYNATIKETNKFLDDLRREKAKAEQVAKEMEAAQKAVGETIVTLKRRRTEDGTKGSDYLADRIARGRGSMFDWPIRGQISSPFGTRVHPVFRTKSFHSGIDISATKGTPVKAAATGEVLFVGWMRGYGQVVILDHRRDYSTVYAHMSSTTVKEGTVVKAGATIGAVGNTGTTTGYHLHFEVRVGSEAKNPLDYLKK
jgi:murein DD-endopeptidase MepM/ murein hydrolase activator NlpD